MTPPGFFHTVAFRMKLPNAEKAVVPKAKIVNYLLSASHRVGKSKAAFFESFGFRAERWEDLVTALQQQVRDHPVVETEETRFGARFVVDGDLIAPTGARLNIRSVWFIGRNESTPRFVTAHPLKRKLP